MGMSVTSGRSSGVPGLEIAEPGPREYMTGPTSLKRAYFLCSVMPVGTSPSITLGTVHGLFGKKSFIRA